MGIPAFYFDGKTSRRMQVELFVEGNCARIAGEAERLCPLDELRVSERTRHAPRKVTFPDGAYLEIQDNAAFNDLLAETGHRDPMAVRLQQSWRNTLLATLALIALLALGYQYGLPAVSEAVANALPEQVERSIGRETLEFLDARLLEPSELSAERQRVIIERFHALTPPAQGAPTYRILFRKSKIGPNAMALPSGDIIVTDEIVELVGEDDALMGILAHELGHLHERHIMRRIIQSSSIGAAATLLFGDVSAVVANIPTFLLDQKYSRDAEREADDYAVAMLKANGISLSGFRRSFELLAKETGDGSPYLSSHPPAAERIERIR